MKLRIWLGLVLLVSAAADVRVRARESKPAGRHALLVGCTRYPNLADSLQLRGPANDVLLMRDLLAGRFGFSLDNIMILSEDAGGDKNRPTRANIEREFRRLAEVAKAGNQVVIFMAGHGSQQPDQYPPDPADPEPDGFDEIFLPADVGPWNGKKETVANAIVDDELRLWLKDILSNGASLWVIIDSCHSGTMIRGTDEEIPRQVPVETLVPKDVLEKARRRALPAEKTRGSGGETSSFDLTGPGLDLAAIYACQPDESTVEKPLPADSKDRKPHGILTYAMNEVLTQAGTPLTYTELVQRIHSRYLQWGRTYPTPLVEGKDRDREVLGARQWPGRSRILLTRDDDGLKVNAGSLHGLTAGSILAVYPAAGQKEAGKVLGHVRVLDQGFAALQAKVAPCEYARIPAPNENSLPAGGRCAPVYIDFGISRPRLAVDKETDAKEPLPAPERDRVGRMLAKLGKESNSLIQVVAEPNQASWLLRLDSIQAGKWHLVPASGLAARGDTAEKPPLFGPVPTDADMVPWLTDRLGRIGRAQCLFETANRSSSERVGATRVKIKVEQLRFKDQTDRIGQPLRWQADGFTLQPGDIVGFRVTNEGREPVDVTFLFIDGNFGITPVFPASAAADNRIAPKGESVLPRFKVNATTVGLEKMVVIAVKAKAVELNVDFSFLAQPSVERARGAGVSRRGGEETVNSPLGRLFQYALYNEGNNRGLAGAELDDLALEVLSWRVVPRQPGGDSK